MADTSRMKPEFAVYLDGTKLKPEEAGAILGIRVHQTRAGASAFELIVSDPQQQWQAKPTFIDCKECRIELGVPGKLKTVFDGEVTAWRTELERNAPSVLVVRGLDRSHRLMRGHKTKTFKDSTPLDVAKQIAGQHGLTARTRSGSPNPVKTFRFQANQSDFEFLRSMADLEGYMFWIEAKELHFERPEVSSTDDAEFEFGHNLKTFLPVANFRRPAQSVHVGGWDPNGKAEVAGKAKKGDELWTVPGGKHGCDVAKFTSSKTGLSLVDSQVATQEHADTVAKAALTRRAMQFLTAECEVQGDPRVKPGALVNLKKVGAYSGHYLVTEASHFYDAAGYHCIFYVARDKWGDSSTEKEKKNNSANAAGAGSGAKPAPYKSPKPPPPKGKPSFIDFTLEDDDGKALKNVQVRIHLKSGDTLDATTDGSGHVRIDDRPDEPYTVEIVSGKELTSIEIKVEDPEGNPVTGATGEVALSDGTTVKVMTDVRGEIHLTDVPAGEYKLKLDDGGSGAAAARGKGGSGGEAAAEKDGGEAAREGDAESPAETKPGSAEARETPASDPEANPPPAAEKPANEPAGSEDEAPRTATLIEVEDAHFRFDSAVFLPEPASDSGADAPPPETIVGLDTLKTVYLRAEEFPAEKILVAGHTDTKGSEAYNLPLSSERAAAVVALLQGDGDGFAGISQARHQPKDVQQILAWTARTRLWESDPGKVDGTLGPKTQAALKAFKQRFNAELGGSLTEDAKVDRPFWGAVFDLYMVELAKLLDCTVPELASARAALHWVDSAQPSVGCGESWPIENAGKNEFRSATNRRVEILFFDAGEEPKLLCHAAAGKCDTAQCELYAPGKYQRTPLPVHPHARAQSSPSILVPQEPGSTTLIAPDGLHAYLAVFKDATLERVTHFIVEAGKLTLPSATSPAAIDCGGEAFLYFSHRGDLADAPSFRASRFAKDRSGLPLIGPVTVPCGTDAKLRIDLWAQNDWVVFRSRQVDGAGPDAVKMVEWREDYKLGIGGNTRDGKAGFWIYGAPAHKDTQERWLGKPGAMIDLARLGTSHGAPLLVGTMSAAPSPKLKIVALKNGAVVASWNELVPGAGNVDLPGMHQYDRALVARLAALKESDQGNAAIDALPNPPARFLLPGDMNWQDQGATNNCGAYSFASAMNYWFPYTNHVGAKDGAFYGDTSRVPSLVNGARTPANVAEAAGRFGMNGKDHDAEELDKARALKLLKLWVMAGVPTLVLVEEDSASNPISRMFSYHWKVVMGWDGDRIFMNNSGGDQEWDISLRKPGFDYEHGPVGNDVDPLETHWEKWKDAGGDIVDLVTSVDECTFIPLYPQAAEFAGDKAR